jgi:glycolate oxidase FAD binding subunit
MEVLDAEASAEFWRRQRDVDDLAEGAGDIWRVSCRPTEGAALAQSAGAEGALFDWAGGLIWLRTSAGTDLRSRLGRYDGHATLVRADAETRQRLGTFEPEAPGVARLTRGLRAQFDPRGLFAGKVETRQPALS